MRAKNAKPKPAAKAKAVRLIKKGLPHAQPFGAKLAGPLANAARAAFARVRAEHPEEHFYFFALFTTDAGSYVTATAASEEGLAQTVAGYRASKPAKEDAALARELRFSAPDSPYHDLPLLGSPRPGRPLHEACFAALSQLDREGLFGRGAERDRVIVNVVYGDMSDERWLAHAKRLNPTGSIANAMPYLRLNLPAGAVTRWGGSAYQVNSLSLSADRQRIAYSGSGGEVGVFDVKTKKALFSQRRRGSHWACALSPDGARLYLGDEAALLRLDVATGEVITLKKTDQVRALAVSPDERRLALATYSSPLEGCDATGKELWRRAEDVIDAAFSPDGATLAVTTAEHVPRVLFLDPADGSLRAEAALAPGRSPVLAWMPDGTSVVACTSVPRQPYPSGDAELRQLDLGGREVGPRLSRAANVEGIAVSPSGARLALLEKRSLVVIDREGQELARGQGGQESLIDVRFLDEHCVVAVGRDVNRGPALLELAVPR